MIEDWHSWLGLASIGFTAGVLIGIYRRARDAGAISQEELEGARAQLRERQPGEPVVLPRGARFIPFPGHRQCRYCGTGQAANKDGTCPKCGAPR